MLYLFYRCITFSYKTLLGLILHFALLPSSLIILFGDEKTPCSAR